MCFTTTWFGIWWMEQDPGVLWSTFVNFAFRCSSISPSFQPKLCTIVLIYVCILPVITTFIMKVLVHCMFGITWSSLLLINVCYYYLYCCGSERETNLQTF